MTTQSSQQQAVQPLRTSESLGWLARAREPGRLVGCGTYGAVYSLGNARCVKFFFAETSEIASRTARKEVLWLEALRATDVTTFCAAQLQEDDAVKGLRQRARELKPGWEFAPLYVVQLEYTTDLGSWMWGQRTRPWQQRLRCARLLLEKLCALEEIGVRHGDLKPGNIVLDIDGSSEVRDLRLVDFGSATFHGASTSYRCAAEKDACKQPAPRGLAIEQTVAYAAPELLVMQPGKETFFGTKTDVFAAGLIIYTLALGCDTYPRAISLLQDVRDIEEQLKAMTSFYGHWRALFSQRATDSLRLLAKVARERNVSPDEVGSERWHTDLLERLSDAALHPDPRRRPSAQQLCDFLGQLAGVNESQH